MSARILYYAVFLGGVASGCSGSSEDQSGSGQGGMAATGGKNSNPAATGGKDLGGNTTGATLSGGQLGSGAKNSATGGALPLGGASSLINSGGNNATTVATGGAGNAGRSSFGSTAKGGSATVGGSNSGSSKAGSSASGNHNAGTNHGGAATGGGVASAGKSTGNNSFAGAASGGKGTGGSSNTGGKSGVGGAGGGGGANAQIVLPEANASFDYQIGGAYSPPTGVRVVSRDRNSAPAAGLYNICYVNGFQIQPDEESFWSSQHPNLILKDGSGNPVVDEDWGETLLDTSTAAKRTELAAVIGGWISKCKTDGFNAVEIDNLDSYSRSNGLLNEANNVAFMALLATAAHTSGLAIAQKNSSELLGSVSTMKTDFAIVEECNRYSECDQYQEAYGNLVFIIEYRQQDFQKGCTAYPELSIVLRNLDVSAPGSSGYVYQGC